jgi:hypothetical protein
MKKYDYIYGKYFCWGVHVGKKIKGHYKLLFHYPSFEEARSAAKFMHQRWELEL